MQEIYGAETTADQATKELAAIAIQYSKTITEVATFIAEYKASAEKTDINSLEETESSSTITDGIELEELDSETLAAIETAKQALLQREANENTAFGDLGGVILEADLILKLQQGRSRAWNNPATRKALEGLIDQGSKHRVATLLGKPSTSGVMKLKPLSLLLQPTVTTVNTTVVDTTSGGDKRPQSLMCKALGDFTPSTQSPAY